MLARESDLVDGLGVRDGVSVLDDRHGLSSENGLVNTQGCRVDLAQAQVGGDLVSNCKARGVDQLLEFSNFKKIFSKQ